ncbi:MAG: 30S ribosomal protein S20 [Candidatus Zambryskibacteria bacterium CG11_big_fil_rev_8_21_14_0_20_42_18]|uniref:Small ribosomal subunit protein bS20 n=1 Tax=Candidatus Zambryskibacteria bacterium CG_4_9_14_3_um_filter_42_15 TaxID=1975112 RepID=A0A2M7WSN8_9BACT|nr:MAG: 30S ribosomal protein S20 [Candidatus Zambryskibacteria bacterium CG11_big_fil_rev_8_21_14_0_20_42_18]PJA32994.1 MAG: 30S ribosomal protein S20 [Candidatus Zambryskibacteria bacterium CG_4_9_14_3_um_filter_42_15]
MSVTKGAKKAHRSSLNKRVHNLRRKSKVSTAIKSFKKLVASGSKKEAEAMMREVQSALDKAVKGKTIKKNTASRKKSRLTKLVKKLS